MGKRKRERKSPKRKEAAPKRVKLNKLRLVRIKKAAEKPEPIPDVGPRWVLLSDDHPAVHMMNFGQMTIVRTHAGICAVPSDVFFGEHDDDEPDDDEPDEKKPDEKLGSE